jgi:hypothetical protein
MLIVVVIGVSSCGGGLSRREGSTVILVDRQGLVEKVSIRMAAGEDLPNEYEEVRRSRSTHVLQQDGHTVRIFYGSSFCYQQPTLEVNEAGGMVAIRVDRGVDTEDCGATLTPWLIEIRFREVMAGRQVEVRVHGGGPPPPGN